MGVIEIDEILYKNLIMIDNFYFVMEEKGIMKKDNVILFLCFLIVRMLSIWYIKK